MSGLEEFAGGGRLAQRSSLVDWGRGGGGRDVFRFEQVSDILFKNWEAILDTRKQRLLRGLPKYQLVWGGLHHPMNCCV